MMRPIVTPTLTGLALATLHASAVHAETAPMPFTGHLTTTAGTAVEDGMYEVRFEVYDVSGENVWSEVQYEVEVAGGAIDVILGEIQPFSFDFDTGHTLGMTMTPGGASVTPKALLGTVVTSTTLTFTGHDLSYGEDDAWMYSIFEPTMQAPQSWIASVDQRGYGELSLRSMPGVFHFSSKYLPLFDFGVGDDAASNPACTCTVPPSNTFCSIQPYTTPDGVTTVELYTSYFDDLRDELRPGDINQANIVCVGIGRVPWDG